MPIRPYESKCENALMANEEWADMTLRKAPAPALSAEEMEMEAEIARKSKAIEEVEARLKELERATEAMNADDEDTEGNEEPARLKKLPIIHGPSEKEREEHERFHIPYRSWCEVCVQAKKKNPPHYAVKDKRTYPVISMDYLFVSDKSAILVLKDANFGGTWALVVLRKGSAGEYAATRVADILHKIGYPRCVLKCDQEPAIVEVSKEVRKELWREMKEIAKGAKGKHDGDVTVMDEHTPVEVIQEHSPVGESSSNGMVERAIQEVSGQIRALKLHIESKAKTKIEASHPLWPWLIEYAAMCIYMYQVGTDGKTARQRTRGRGAMASTVGFGEQVLYKPMKTVKLDKGEARWLRGTWIGIIDHTNEHIIGTSEGVVKCRAIHPREKDMKWDVEAMASVKGLPWKPNPNRRSLRIPTRIIQDDEEASEGEDGDPDMAPEDVEGDFEVKIDEKEDEEKQREAIKRAKEEEKFDKRNAKPYTMYIMKSDIIKYGPTAKCAGCKYVLGERKYAEGHSKECKERIQEAMKADPDDANRVERDERKKEKREEESKDEKEQEKRKNEDHQRQRKKSRIEEREPEADPSSSSSSSGAVKEMTLQERTKRKVERKDESEEKSEAKRQCIEDSCLFLTGRSDEGEVLDFSRVKHRNSVMRKIIEIKPKFIVGEGIHEKMGEQHVNEEIKSRYLSHLDFLGKVYEFQQRQGDYYVHISSPTESESIWKEGIVKDRAIRAVKSRSHSCYAKALPRNDAGHLYRPCISPSSFSMMTNSACVLEAVDGEPEKVGSRKTKQAKDGEIILKKETKESLKTGMVLQRLCDEKDEYILGVLNHVSDEALKDIQNSSEKCHAEKENNLDVEEQVAFDDVSGNSLKPELVRQARKEEIQYFKKLGVYTKVSREKCMKETGKKPIQVRWIDVNKGDDLSPIYRSRLVAKEFKTNINLDWYAATPPLETLRSLVSFAATTSFSSEGQNKIMVNDISRAYFYAPCTTPTFVEICEEDYEEGDELLCGELKVSMYGTRSAACNWQRCYSDLLLSAGFARAKSNTCVFYHPLRKLRTMVHGDDFVTVGSGCQLKWMQKVLESKFETKTNIIGPEVNDEKAVRVLNRIITYTPSGIEYEADQRHVESMVKDMNMEQAKTLSVAGSDDPDHSETSETPLNRHYESIYRSVVAKGNYLAADRPDMQFATKECAKGMSAPTECHWTKLKKLVRYLKGKPRVVVHYAWQEPCNKMTVYSDANWAGDKQTRKSTSGGCIMLNKHWIKSWSKSQSTVALSSAESELYACIKAASEGLGMISMMNDLGISIMGEIRSDASAALGIIARTGLGKLRHIDTSYLWIQQVSAEKKLSFGKVDGKENAADMMTKNLSRELSEEHCERIQLEFRNGRHEKAPEFRG